MTIAIPTASPSALSLSERIMGLRIAAALLYDQGLAKGIDTRQIGADIQPIRRKMKELIEGAVPSDLGGLVLAMQRLESQAQAHERDMKFLAEKASDARRHIAEIESTVMAKMKALGVLELTHGDYSVTLTGSGETERLRYR